MPQRHVQRRARRFMVDAVDAASKNPDLTRLDGALQLRVYAGRDAMAMSIPERADVTEESLAFGDRPAAPERRRDAAQLGEGAPPLVAARIVRAELAHETHHIAQRGRQRVDESFRCGGDRSV